MAAAVDVAVGVWVKVRTQAQVVERVESWVRGLGGLGFEVGGLRVGGST